MLILHQTGSVKVGEVVRYTLTYTPALDRILPPPPYLYVKIKNTSAIPLRAAYLHGPYTLYVACYPSTFDPNVKHETFAEEGEPDYEPMLKAGGHWSAKLSVPKSIRDTVERDGRRSTDEKPKGFTWIIEVASQVLFSTTANVHFELLVGRDERSVDLGFHGMVGSNQGLPGKLEDHQQGRVRNNAQPKGVFSKAVRLVVDDTQSLWNTPQFPHWDEQGQATTEQGPKHGDKRDAGQKKDKKQKKQKKIHLVLLTHGIHSNVPADMLYMKESIDTAAKQAREDWRRRKAEMRASKDTGKGEDSRSDLGERAQSAPKNSVGLEEEQEEDEDEQEQVIVRGFTGNAVRTERGIQYLGKRLAKYVLSITYPDQPYLPVKSSISQSITRPFKSEKSRESHMPGPPAHKNSSIVKDEKHQNHNLAYKITSISFVAHSLGGLVQTYAIAYIQKHSPEFFELIKPINFVTLASPFLGVSNENPMYVKFALDSGLVGRTGQDLGLTWRPPTIAKNSWGAVIGSLTNEKEKASKDPDPSAKPLLRILPTGPAHVALKKFRNRTVYSNVVNDGIVPLRTSCLLFLDWRGLDRVEKARRDNGLVGTMVNWGWTEMMGENATTARRGFRFAEFFSDSGDEGTHPKRNASPDPGNEVPQADAAEGLDVEQRTEPDEQQFLNRQKSYHDEMYGRDSAQQSSSQGPASLWTGLVSIFRPGNSAKPRHQSPKRQKIYNRGQTMAQKMDDKELPDSSTIDSTSQDTEPTKPGVVRGSSLYGDSESGNFESPPKTTFFESAGDLLNPPLPPKEFLLDPATRPRTIFHDRVYHPNDIPAPPAKRQRTFFRSISSSSKTELSQQPMDHRRQLSGDHHAPRNSVSSIDSNEVGAMKIEEKIARAYHKDLSWRKVLVRLEPDAHNNIIVRRMFANAYGWPVVKHLCDTHFAYTKAATTRDEEEAPVERAKEHHEDVGEEGEQVKGQVDPPSDTQHLAREREEQRAKTMDDVAVGDGDNATDIGEVEAGLRKIRSKKEPRSPKRTPSEIREARDEVPALISQVDTQGEKGSHSNATTSKAALSRLNRADSARWSDRFFEGDDVDDEDDDDEAYLEELRKAIARGQPLTQSEQILADKLTESPESTVGGRKNRRRESLGWAGGAIPPDDAAHQGMVEEPESMPNASSIGLGLATSPEVSGQRPHSAGVVKQVALAHAMDGENSKRSDGSTVLEAKRS